MRRFYIGALILVFVVLAVLSIVSSRFSRIQQPSSTTSLSHLVFPQGWRIVQSNNDTTLVKLQKVNDKKNPAVVLIYSLVPNGKNPHDYVESLIKGTFSALPTITLSENKEDQKDGYYIRTLKGSYPSEGKTISVLQMIYIKGKNAYTLTGSYIGSDPSFEKEITTIFDTLYTGEINR